MDVADEVSIDGTREDIWALISDPEVLMSCVPGAEEVERLDERTYRGTIVRGIAGITVSMNGEVHLVDLDPPNVMAADVSGEDERTGSRMDAEAELSLVSEGPDRTTLDYVVDVSFSGKLASVGSRLLRRKIDSDIDQFFENIQRRVEDGED